jgi:hypothetical protein
MTRCFSLPGSNIHTLIGEIAGFNLSKKLEIRIT